jgi:hypothetical protein
LSVGYTPISYILFSEVNTKKMYNIKENYEVKLLVYPEDRAVSGVGPSVDVEKYLADALVLLTYSTTGADATDTHTFKVTGSKDGGSTFPDIIGNFEEVNGTMFPFSSLGIDVSEYTHIRAEWTTVAGNAPVFICSALLVLNTQSNVDGMNSGYAIGM